MVSRRICFDHTFSAPGPKASPQLHSPVSARSIYQRAAVTPPTLGPYSPTHTQLHSLVAARSTYHNRTLVTLQSVLEGLLGAGPQGGAAGKAQEAAWKVEVRKTNDETLYANAHACKALGMLLAEADKATKTVGETEGAVWERV